MAEPPPSPPRRPRLIDDERKFCPGCNYNLTGQIAADIMRCPECGRRFNYSELLDFQAADAEPDEPAVEADAWWHQPAMTLWVIAPAMLVGVSHTWAGLSHLKVAALGSAPPALYLWAWVIVGETEVRRRWLHALLPALLACAGNAAVLAMFGAFEPHGRLVFMIALATASLAGIGYCVRLLRR